MLTQGKIMELWNVWYNGLHMGTVRAQDALDAEMRARTKYGTTRAEVKIRPCSPTTQPRVVSVAAACIERVRALAMDALRQYNEETAAGSEPAYPQWIDDVFVVVGIAELTVHRS